MSQVAALLLLRFAEDRLPNPPGFLSDLWERPLDEMIEAGRLFAAYDVLEKLSASMTIYSYGQRTDPLCLSNLTSVKLKYPAALRSFLVSWTQGRASQALIHN